MHEEEEMFSKYVSTVMSEVCSSAVLLRSQRFHTGMPACGRYSGRARCMSACVICSPNHVQRRMSLLGVENY